MLNSVFERTTKRNSAKAHEKRVEADEGAGTFSSRKRCYDIFKSKRRDASIICEQ